MNGAHPRRRTEAKAATTAILLLLASAALLIGGCGGSPKKAGAGVDGGSDMPDATPKVEPKSRYGNMKSYVVFGKTYYPKPSSRGYVERGIASWYGPKFHGRKTSSGEPYDMHQMTAAHKTLPLPTYARVTNLENGRSTIVRINDRGPFVGDRIIDLSFAAAKKLGVDKKGLASVEVASIDPRDHDGKVPRHFQLAADQQRKYKSERSRTEPETAAWSTDGPKPAPAQATEAIGTARSQRTPSLAESGSSAVAAQQGQALAPAAAVAAEPSASSLASDGVSDEQGLYLQVGAFGTRHNAEQMRQRLTSVLQDPVQVREGAGGTAAPYKVQVGPVSTRSDADSLSVKLASLGVGKPILVQN